MGRYEYWSQGLEELENGTGKNNFATMAFMISNGFLSLLQVNESSVC